jgi:APA family basic amino acid/polyamine antiporter
MAVAAAALGGSTSQALAASGEPLAMVLRELNHGNAARFIAGVAVLALPTVIMAFMYGQSRVFFVMARDGLLPQHLSKLSPRTGTPITMTFVTAIVVSALAGFLPLQQIAELANAGTLCAFVAVAVCMLIMRRRARELPRAFRTPLANITGPLAIVGCIYLFFSLLRITQVAFVIWNVIGVIVYVLYARHASALAKTA